jgi:hypothetical protein
MRQRRGQGHENAAHCKKITQKTSEETKKLQLLRADKDYTDKKLQQLLRAGMRRRK